MPDYYHAPALVLSALLLPAFGYLYLRFRDTRTLLWFLGFLFALFSMVLRYVEWPWSFAGQIHSWMIAAGHTSMLIGSALFIASLTPLRFRMGRLHVLYVIPYTIPLVIASILFYVVFHDISPSGPRLWLFPGLGAISLVVALLWGAAQSRMPSWLGVSFCAVMGSLTLRVCFTAGASWALTFAECANLLMTALLLAFVFRRFSPGVVLSVMGFTAWSLSGLQILPAIGLDAALNLNLIHVIVMGKVVAALGMIMLALEDEIYINKAAQERERRARRELEAYTNLMLARRRVEDFDRQGSDICQVVVTHSRFAQAALLLENAGRYGLAGSAGLDEATVAALGELAARIPAAGFLAPGSAPPAVEHSQTLSLDLTQWLKPGDDLKRLRFTGALAVPMTGRSITEGALLLAGMRPTTGSFQGLQQDALRADDLLPIEMLAARLQATRSQTMMFEKLIDSEKFAGLGQLASNVTHHLNNPLTVVLGYASLLEETVALDAPERRGVTSILTEARRMRSTLESLTRISRVQNDQLAAVSVAELLADMEQLHRSELLQRSIELQLNVAPALPRVLCSAQQLRQAVLHCLQYSIAAVENQGPASIPEGPKTIRLEATAEGRLVQILVAHSGPGFLNPERAFDPFMPTQIGGETTGLGLSLCATILRDQNGRASAVNLDPRGAAIILELRKA
ncbi:MAG TPA: histidine kinase dimerization/phospho-acceptor domain-containing protein [Terracidiphilus sp.]|nr:histidine kinase dimerization/phospho-acceptor domain-containing protein [Terracidiphilus sp.]